MPQVNNVELNFSKHSNTEWNVTVTGDVVFSPSETENYRLEIKLFSKDFVGDDGGSFIPLNLNPSPIYTFVFPIGSPPIFLGSRTYKNISANSGLSLPINETRRVDRTILDEDPGFTWVGNPPFRFPLRHTDEIYAVVTVSQFESSGKSATKTITA